MNERQVQQNKDQWYNYMNDQLEEQVEITEYQRQPKKRIKIQEIVNDQEQNYLEMQDIVEWVPTWLYWKWNTFYNKEGNTFTKINQNFIRKTCAQEPFPNRGKYKFSLRVISQGTISFGIITDYWFDEPSGLVDWKKQQAIFLTSFNLSGGVINIDGNTNTVSGNKLHLAQGQKMYVTIDMDRRSILYVKDEIITNVPFSINFIKKPIFPFFQVKEINASIQIINCW